MIYVLKARHYNGFGIHSPFVFYLVRELIYERTPFTAFSKISAARKSLKQNKRTVNVETPGAPSVKAGATKKIKKLVSENSIPDKYGRLMFRLANHFEARNLLEIGTGTGISTLYLALHDSRASVVTIEGNRQLSILAKGLFEIVGVNNIILITGLFSEEIPEVLSDKEKLDFVFFDGDHRFDSTLEYFEMCLSKVHNDTIFVFDDIHWSPEMEKAWEAIVKHPLVKVSLDLFRIGIVFFRKECVKQHYVVMY